MKTITIDGVEYVAKKDIKEKVQVVAPHGDKSNPFMEVGESYFIRTVTHYFTGRLIWVGEKEIVLEEACWVSDTGRFNEFLSKNTFNESEPFPKSSQVIVGRGAIIDMVKHELILIVK